MDTFKREKFELNGVVFQMKPRSPKVFKEIENAEDEDVNITDWDAYAEYMLRLVSLVAEPLHLVDSQEDATLDDVDIETLDIAAAKFYVGKFNKALSMTASEQQIT
jgi:hypothetical protein